MTEVEIIEIFIRAAEVDRKLPDTARPKRLKAINHGYVHDLADINGWDSADKEALRWEWLDPAKLRNTTNDIGIWYAAMEIIKLVPDDNQRRALWAWARSEAGGKAFAKWCKSDGNGPGKGISRQLGNYRKDRALLHVVSAFSRKPLQHNETDEIEHFTNQAENEDIKSNIEVWRADDAKPALSFDEGLQDFSWSEMQNARRREREARKRQAA